MPAELPNVLIVDDDEMIRELASEAVVAAGFVPCEAEHPIAAMAVLAAKEVAVIVSDLTMPKKSGIAFLNEIRFAGYKQPFIILTGNGSKESAIEALRLGALDYLEKPFDLDTLKDLVASAVALVQAGREVIAVQTTRDRARGLLASAAKLRQERDPGARVNILAAMLQQFEDMLARGTSAEDPLILPLGALGAHLTRLLLADLQALTTMPVIILGQIIALLEETADPLKPRRSEADFRQLVEVVQEFERRQRASA